MFKPILMGSLAALSLAACADMDGSGGGSTAMATSGAVNAAQAAAPSAGALGPMDYVMAAGQSDQFEIQSSQLALQKSRDPRVRDFANMMIRDHGTTTTAVIAAARQSGMTPPPPPPLRADQQQMMAQLQGVAGPAFDQLYVQQQVMAHQQALDLHSSFAQGGTDPNLRRAAQSAVPIVTHHFQMAQQLAGAMPRG